MSITSDVKDLYGTLQTTWSTVRTHVISHFIFLALLFTFGVITFTSFHFPDLNPKEITDNAWFKLAKASGLIYLCLAVPFLATVVYIAGLEFFGTMFSTFILLLFTNRDQQPLAKMSANELAPIAMLLPNDKFSLSDVLHQSTIMIIKFKHEKPEEWQAIQKQFITMTGNSLQYLGDFCTLFLVWIILFKIFQSDKWIHINHSSFIWMLLILLTLIWLCTMRALHVVAALPVLQIKVVSARTQMDSSLMRSGEETDETYERRRLRLETLLEAEKKEEERVESTQPSFQLLLGFTKRPTQCSYDPTTKRNELSFYKLGEHLDMYGSPLDLSIYDVLAYKFYATWRRLTNIYRLFLSLLRYALTGVPPI